MRRAVCVLSIGALVAALWSGIASAAFLRNATPISLSQEVFRRSFGESPDAAPSGESPLAQYAFTVSVVQIAEQQPVALDVPEISIPHLAAMTSYAPPTPGAVSYSAPLVRPSADQTTTLQPTEAPAPSVGYYRGPQPRATQAPSSYRFDLPGGASQSAVSFGPVLNPAAAFTASNLGTDDQSSLPQVGGAVSVPMRLGHVHLQTHADAGQARSDAMSLNDTAMGGGATFDTRLGKWQKLGVDLSSHYEHLTVDQPVFSAATLDGTSNLDVAGENLPVFVPAYADISKHTVSAGLAVPLSRRMTANLQVDSQHLLGGYGTPGLTNLDANNTIYGARLTYQLKGSSAISLTAKQFRYQDNLIPLNAFTQTSADLNFTVKF